MKIRVGVVGIGFGQHVHVPCFRSDSRCTVVMIAASDNARARSVAEQLGVPRCTGNWEEVVNDDEVDAVSIAIPPRLQPDIALAALKRGKAVFCEKPLGLSIIQAEVMASAARSLAVPGMVDFEFPELPLWHRARSLVANGDLGAVAHASINWHLETYAKRMKRESWKTRFQDGGGALYSFVPHVFFYIEWLLGPIRRIAAHLSRSPEDPGNADTIVSMILELVSGAVVSVSVHTSASRGSGHRIEVHGETATMVLENTTSDYLIGFRLWVAPRGSDQWQVEDESGATSGAGDGRIRAVRPIVSRFLDWVKTGQPARPDLQDGVRVQTLLEAALQSARLGRFVDLSSSATAA